MRYIADLHIHSHYSRATSRELDLEHLVQWAQIKGLRVIATGDITHPRWLAEMRSKLAADDCGLYYLKSTSPSSAVPGRCRGDVRFILSGEISTIYKRGDRVRKVHHLVFMPTLDAVEKFQNRLDRIGNIHSDGRPILGLDSRDLLEIVLETDPDAALIPAHIWTPWFSLLGSKSGFDAIDDCYGDLTPHIFALETGLSSDPPMNYRLSALDPYNLVSNSDAHSPAKLAREANIFNTELSYESIFSALKEKHGDAFWGTIEFYPEEGKYHMDGHKKCGCMLHPRETLARGGLCPVCGKPVTLGVSYRIEQLADRPPGERPEGAKSHLSLIPLTEVLAEVKGKGPNSKGVQSQYLSLLNKMGAELEILIERPLSDVAACAGPLAAEGIRRMREGEVRPQPGYDGEYGVIRLFEDSERRELLAQGSFFRADESRSPHTGKKETETEPVRREPFPGQETVQERAVQPVSSVEYNEEQRAAIRFRGAPLVILAGPGTGKTQTLTRRIAALVESGDAEPGQILAVTFTTKAAQEMRERLERGFKVKGTTVCTFHAFALDLLRQSATGERDFRLVNPLGDEDFCAMLAERCGGKVTRAALDRISLLKGQLVTDPGEIPKEQAEQLPGSFSVLFREYNALMRELKAMDFDDLIILAIRILNKDPETRRRILLRYPVVSVDEFQDINRSQYELFRTLAIAARDVCVIGDPDQAIYGFRGASRRYFTRFATDFPNAKTIRLYRNYRSAQNILYASVQMLEGEETDALQKIRSDIAADVKISIHRAATERAEAEYLVRRIEQMIGGTSYFSIDSDRVDDRGLPREYTFSDFAVLLRTKRLAPPLVEALTRSGMPFETIGHEPLAAHPLVRNMIAVLNGIRPHAAAPVLDKAAGDYFGGGEKVQLLIEQLRGLSETADVSELIDRLWREKENPADAPIYQRCRALAVPFQNRIGEFLDSLALSQENDLLDENADRIHILTLHAAKGLEFAVVFIIGCEEEILPFRLARGADEVEEERRLLYVGMTRAKRRLYLTHTRTRNIDGKRRIRTPSRFLSPISETVVQREREKSRSKRHKGQMNLFS